jgi:hypothetical protein
MKWKTATGGPRKNYWMARLIEYSTVMEQVPPLDHVLADVESQLETHFECLVFDDLVLHRRFLSDELRAVYWRAHEADGCLEGARERFVADMIKRIRVKAEELDP